MVPEKLSAIRRCPLFGVSAIRRVLKYGIYGKRSWYIAHCPLYGRCPLFGVSAKRGSTVYSWTFTLNFLPLMSNNYYYTKGENSVLLFYLCKINLRLNLLVFIKWK